jgi:hypothetical protein
MAYVSTRCRSTHRTAACIFPPVMNELDDLQSALAPTYRLERELGGGGRARVFVAVETALNRRVAI